MNEYCRLLILSNECLSQTTSNGRTLRNFLYSWPKDRLAQFCIKNNAPDFSVCDRYYCVSDKAALKSFFKGPHAGTRLREKEESEVTAQSVSAGKKRNAVTMIMRDLVWNSMRWAGDDFYGWVEEFHPELILLQAGDCGFMLRLARRLAEKYRIPLVIYNSEAYYFKKRDYFRSVGLSKLLYPLFRSLYCREFEKTIHKASVSIYGCDKLKRDYDAVFGLPSEVIHTATQLCGEKKDEVKAPVRISYLGNLGVGRHESLVAIAETLGKISPELKLDVYGRIPNETVEKAFADCPAICCRGFVSYQEVIRVMAESDILIHAESFTPFYKEDLQYAFSTKIADCLASGKCFVLYAPKQMACSEYLSAQEAAYVVTQPDQLLPVLQKVCREPEARTRYLTNAKRLVDKNHNLERNSDRFRRILQESVLNT